MLALRPSRHESIDPESVSPSGPQRAWKQAGLLLLCVVWIGLGLTGHDPWKTEDAVTFGLAIDVSQRGDLVQPLLVGEPRLDHGPLVPALAAVTLRLFSPPLAAHDAARLAAGLLLALVLLGTSLAARQLNGRAFRWMPVLILIGSVGFWERSHALSGDLGATLGVAVAMAGLGAGLRHPLSGGVIVGLGAAIGFLSNGLLVPLWLLVTLAVLPLTGRTWRTREFAALAAIAVIVAALLCGLWLAALYMRDPAALTAWRATETLNRYLGFRDSVADFEPSYAIRNLLWFAWPALPLTLWTLWTRGRGFNGGLADPGLQVPAVMAVVMLASMTLMANPSLISMLPLLVPFAVLGALEVDTLKRGFSGALDWFGILTFGLLGTLVWAVWIDAYLYGMAPQVSTLFRDTEFGYRPSFKLTAILLAVFLTLLWIVLVRPARKSNRRALLNWAAGVMLLWGLYSTIWLPYLDSRRSYRWVAEALQAHVPEGSCVVQRNVGDPQRALLNYFGALTTLREGTPAAAACTTLLVQYTRQAPEEVAGWTRMWTGARRGDNTESFALYTRSKP